LHRVIFEIRYNHGYTYLDRCGKTVNSILQSMPEWILKSEQISPQNAPLVSTANQCTFNFSSNKMRFSIEQPANAQINSSEIERFVEQVDSVSSIVIEHLSLKEFTRIGTRIFYLFPFQDQTEVERWIADLGVFSLSDRFLSAFGGPVENAGVSLVIPGQERTYRICLNGVEKLAQIDFGSEILSLKTTAMSKEQKRTFKQRQPERTYSQPHFAAMIDIDAYLEDPRQIDPKDFVSSSITDSARRLEAAIRADI